MATEVASGTQADLLTHTRLTELVAEAYREAALTGAEMLQAAQALESIRTRHAEAGAYEAWTAVDDEVGKAADSALCTSLLSLREALAREMEERALAEVTRAGEAADDQAWATWLRTYVDAFCAWRLEVCAALADGLRATPFGAPSAAELQRMTRFAVQGRWPEANDCLVRLSDEELLEPVRRAQLRVFAAEIQLHYLIEPAKALKHLERAQTLAPDDHMVVGGMGEYWMQQDDLERSRELFQRSISLAPRLSDGYALMGDTYERTNDLDAAENWFRECVNQKPGDSQGYLRLIALYGRPEFIASREQELERMFRRAVLVNPSDEYTALLTVGSAYQGSERYQEAHAWYERAIALDPSRVAAYSSKGFAYLDEDEPESARAAFNRAIDAAPDAFEGYWGLALVAEHQGQLEEALRHYAESISRRPVWEANVRARIADVHRRLARYGEAKAELLKGLRLEPGNQAIQNGIPELLAVANEPDSALAIDEGRRFLEEVRAIAGEAYEATYRNLVGNLSYHDEDYDTAIEAYRRAIEINPTDPVYYGNLAGALYRSHRPGDRAGVLADALSAFQRAAELAPTDPDYRTGISVVRAELSVVRLGGEVAADLPWVLLPIRVDVSAEMLPVVLDEDQENLTSELRDMIDAMRDRLRQASGVWVPGVTFRELNDSAVSWSAYVIRIWETTFPLETVQSDMRFCRAPLEPLTAAGIPSSVHSQSLLGAWVEQAHWKTAEAAGARLSTPLEYMLQHLESVLRVNLEQFVDHQLVASLIADVDPGSKIASSPTLLADLTGVLRALVREGASIVSVATICREFTALAESGVGPLEMLERLRALPEVAPTLAGHDADRALYRVGPHMRAELEQGIVRTGAYPVLALTHDDHRDHLVAIREKVHAGQPAALVVDGSELRPFVRAMVESRYPELPVLSTEELQPEAAARVAGEVDVVRPG